MVVNLFKLLHNLRFSIIRVEQTFT